MKWSPNGAGRIPGAARALVARRPRRCGPRGGASPPRLPGIQRRLWLFALGFVPVVALSVLRLGLPHFPFPLVLTVLVFRGVLSFLLGRFVAFEPVRKPLGAVRFVG